VCKRYGLVADTPDHGENGITISAVIASDMRLACQRRHRRASAQFAPGGGLGIERSANSFENIRMHSKKSERPCGASHRQPGRFETDIERHSRTIRVGRKIKAAL
jgi:hypothetical protein